MRIAITGVRDGLLVVGLALLLSVYGFISFYLAEEYNANEAWAFFAWNSIVIVPAFARAFRGHLKRPFLLPFLAGLVIAHGLICIGLIRWRVPFAYWLPVFIVELSLGAWAAYRFYGIIPSGDI